MPTLSSSQLKNLYLEKQLSTYEIAAMLHLSQSSIMYNLRKYGIRTRGIQAAKALTKPVHKRHDFPRDTLGKAYLVGFRLGDLHVSKTHPNSPTIRISTNTTREEQIELMHELFAPYGYVKAYPRDSRGATSVRCYVNNSFDFLLKKDDCIPSWILKNRRAFAAFFAGYIDAEGSFINKQSRVFSIQVQQKKILCQIAEKLRGYSIPCMKPVCYRKSGSVVNGIRSNMDVWVIQIYKKENLMKLISLVRNYIRHRKRKSDMLDLLQALSYVRA